MLNTSANVLCDRGILGEEMDCCIFLHLYILSRFIIELLYNDCKCV